jgi:hypothetical protein
MALKTMLNFKFRALFQKSVILPSSNNYPKIRFNKNKETLFRKRFSRYNKRVINASKRVLNRFKTSLNAFITRGIRVLNVQNS